MAARYPIPPQAADSVETHINRTIDGLIALLNLRRAQLLVQLREAREEKRAAAVARQEMETQLNTARTALQTHLKENPLQSLQARMVSELEQKLQDLRTNIPTDKKLRLQCDTRDLDMSITCLGEIVQVPVGLPNYGIFHLPTVATGKCGSAPGELNFPRGVAINKATNQIFVVNGGNDTVEIFSETGEHLNLLGKGQLHRPWGLTIHENSLFISCIGSHTITEFSLIDFSLVKKIGKWGSKKGEFKGPTQLTTDPNDHLFIIDSRNYRICVFDTNLSHIRNITHQLIPAPSDIKVSHDRLYVLCQQTNPCMQVLSLEGDMLDSIIKNGEGKDVLFPSFFCFDINNNFVISNTHSILVFSSAGNLLHTIGREGHEQGMFYEPRGIAITPNGKLVCVSNNKNFGLQIFS